jgi:hypothetical protein
VIETGDGWTLANCDCLAGIRQLADNSVDAVVTDPPAGIGFMGKGWDDDKGGRDNWVAWLESVMRECLRVLKPGGHALVWALPRTSHWTATAVEDAGFEIRDVVMHLFGSGFPKSLDISKAIDQAAGAAQWQGWGTALKPAAEHWILARKPLDGTYAANVIKHGTGALNVGGCRIGTSKNVPASPAKDRIGQLSKGDEKGRTADTLGFDPNTGRWPAHLVLSHAADCGAVCVDGCPVWALDEQSGELTSGEKLGGAYARSMGVHDGGQRADGTACYADFGGASRFFYCAKPPRAEKDAGLEHLPKRSGGDATGRADGSAGTQNPRAGAGRNGGARNIHPTVKSVNLMRWLCRLITPPGGLVLDAFAGSGTTGVACIEEGFRFVGYELGAEYFEIAASRLNAATRQLTLFAPASNDKEPNEVAPAQPSLFGAAL